MTDPSSPLHFFLPMLRRTFLRSCASMIVPIQPGEPGGVHDRDDDVSGGGHDRDDDVRPFREPGRRQRQQREDGVPDRRARHRRARVPAADERGDGRERHAPVCGPSTRRRQELENAVQASRADGWGAQLTARERADMDIMLSRSNGVQASAKL